MQKFIHVEIDCKWVQRMETLMNSYFSHSLNCSLSFELATLWHRESLLTTGWTVSQLSFPLCFLHSQPCSWWPHAFPGLCLHSSATSAKRQLLFPKSWDSSPGIGFGGIDFGQCPSPSHSVGLEYPGIVPCRLGWCQPYPNPLGWEWQRSGP